MGFQHTVWWLSGNLTLVALSMKSLMFQQNEMKLTQFRYITLKTVLTLLTEQGYVKKTPERQQTYFR